VGFPRRPRRRQRGAHRRERSGEEVGQCSGPEAATRGEEAIGAVELNGEVAEEGRRADAGTRHGSGEVAAGRRSGWRGMRGKGQQGREAGPRKGETDAWSVPEQEVAPGRSRSDGERR
jgi:hypothetical protein